MNPVLARTLYWTPRVLGILFALFTAVFALDVFGEHYTPAQLAVALGMHLIPTALVALVVAIAWRWERIGALLLFALAAYYAATMGRHHPTWDLAIAGPVVLAGVLFLLSSWARGKAKA